MSIVDLKVGAIVAGTILVFTIIANVIPQVESEVPLQVAFGADVTPEELVSVGEQLYLGAGGCVACHAETAGARAPNLATDYGGQGPIGVRCADRIPGLMCKEYLYQALVRPTDYMIGDYPPIMPPLDRTMSPAQIWSIVAYLESLGGEVTVTAADIPPDPAPGADPGVPAVADAPVGLATEDPVEIVQELCTMCHLANGEGVDLGPPLTGIGGRLSRDELRIAILDPPSVVSPGYEDFVGLMPTTFGQQLSAGQLEAVVQYLSGL